MRIEDVRAGRQVRDRVEDGAESQASLLATNGAGKVRRRLVRGGFVSEAPRAVQAATNAWRGEWTRIRGSAYAAKL